MSNKIAMALLMALGLGTASSASAAVSAPWPPPTNVQTAHPVSGYGYAVSKGKHQRTNHAVRVISEAHGSPMSLAAPATGLLGLETVGWSDRLFRRRHSHCNGMCSWQSGAASARPAQPQMMRAETTPQISVR